MIAGRRLDVAVVGTGAIAAAHAEAVGAAGARARIVAAVEVDPDRLTAFADRWSVPGRFTDLDRMLAEARPDLVQLCTPPSLHRDQALACLRAGVHVLCEKPPALSLAEFDEIAAAEGPGRFATVFQHRFGSAARRLRRLVEEGRLGRPMTALCETLWYRPDDYFAAPWRGRWEAEGGGPTMGHGIHQMDLLLAVLGPWREVVAVAEPMIAALICAAASALAEVSCIETLTAPLAALAALTRPKETMSRE